MVRVIATLDILGGIEFTSPSMEPHQADILLMELGRGPIRVMRARRGPKEATLIAAPSTSTLRVSADQRTEV